MKTHNEDWFSKFTHILSKVSGYPIVSFVAFCSIGVWLLTGPMFNFSDSWQLVINTGTTIITFLMVFLIQNAQYRDSEAIQIKLDELIRTQHGAHKALLDLEELTPDQLDKIKQKYEMLAKEARKHPIHTQMEVQPTDDI